MFPQKHALIIANGESCSSSLLNHVLQQKPFVMALDSAIIRLRQLSIPLDCLVGDFDRAVSLKQCIKSEHIQAHIVHTPDQNKTDLEKGIEYLIAQGFQQVTILWATGRRADHTIANITNMVKYQDRISLEMLDDYSKIVPLPHAFEKIYAKGTILSLIPVGSVEGVETVGLKYPLHHEQLRLGGRIGSSNEVEKDGLVTISYTSGHLLLMECHD